MPQTLVIGTAAAAEQLLQDLYVRLRRDLQRWAAVTYQTPQARMGYVGQHLVSAVTGFPGGRSGARGDDLKLPCGGVAEIKCCYRVDQLGECKLCHMTIASIEKICPNQQCGAEGNDIERKDDSKWLLSVKNEKELAELFIPKTYYFVLFEFINLKKAEDIAVKIFEVNPKCPGFALCMIDYYYNIKKNAPFNLWPDSPKFLMMKPKIIYNAEISASDSIRTITFPSQDRPASLVPFGNLEDYYNRDIPEESIDAFATRMSVRFEHSMFSGLSERLRRKQKLRKLQIERERQCWSNEHLADHFAHAIFSKKLASREDLIQKYAPTLLMPT